MHSLSAPVPSSSLQNQHRRLAPFPASRPVRPDWKSLIEDSVVRSLALHTRCSRATSGPFVVARVYRTTRRTRGDELGYALPRPCVIVIDGGGAALACYSDARPVIAHPTLAELRALHGLRSQDLVSVWRR